VGVFVAFRQPVLMRVLVHMSLTVVGVFMGMLDVVVIMAGMGVDVCARRVLVVVSVRSFVLVFVCHGAAPLLGVLLVGGAEVFDVAQCLGEDGGYVRVVHVVDGAAPLPGTDDQSEIAQDSQLMGHRWLRHPDGLGQLRNRGRLLTKVRQDPDPARRGQRRHQPGHLLGLGQADGCRTVNAMRPRHAPILACAFMHIQWR
jgi:hypothetical protein